MAATMRIGADTALTRADVGCQSMTAACAAERHGHDHGHASHPSSRRPPRRTGGAGRHRAQPVRRRTRALHLHASAGHRRPNDRRGSWNDDRDAGAARWISAGSCLTQSQQMNVRHHVVQLTPSPNWARSCPSGPTPTTRRTSPVASWPLPVTTDSASCACRRLPASTALRIPSRGHPSASGGCAAGSRQPRWRCSESMTTGSSACPTAQLDRHDGRGPTLVGQLLDDVRPDTILTFVSDGITFHPDHIAVHRWVTTAWERAAVQVACSTRGPRPSTLPGSAGSTNSGAST